MPKFLLTVSAFLLGALLIWGGFNVLRVYQQVQVNDRLIQAQQFLEQGQHQSALEIYQSIGVRNERIQFNLAEIYLKLGQAGKAESELSNLPAIESRQQLELVLDLYQRAQAQTGEGDIFTRAQAARELLQENYSALSILALEDIVMQTPDYRDAHLLLAAAYFQNSQAQEALAELGEAAQLDPTYSPTFKLMAEIHQSLGNSEKAHKLEEKAAFLENP